MFFIMIFILFCVTVWASNEQCPALLSHVPPWSDFIGILAWGKPVYGLTPDPSPPAGDAIHPVPRGKGSGYEATLYPKLMVIVQT